MKTKKGSVVFLFMVGLLAMSAIFCNYVPAQILMPTVTPIPTQTLTLTLTPSPAYTPTPTNTPSPIPTFTPAATATPTLGIGSTFAREKDGMQMVYVPAGPFSMGKNSLPISAPEHIVTLDAFWIDQTEVTNAMYAKCVQAGICKVPGSPKAGNKSNYGNSEYDTYPIVLISWEDASAYCTWTDARLPTEAEWEKAARGTDARTYPWGEGLDKSYANYSSTATTAVGSYEKGKSPYGAYDMAGNVWEWVADWFSKSYYKDSQTNNPTGPIAGDSRGIRGGAWSSYVYGSSYIDGIPSFDRNAWGKSNFFPTGKRNDIGFRCVKSN